MGHCTICDEELPHLSRVCPNCLYNDSYSVEFQAVVDPTKMLSMMRSLMDEYLEADMPTLFNSIFKQDIAPIEAQEALATFGSIKDVVMLSFGKNHDVVDAIISMEDLLYERVELRRQRVMRFRWIACLVGISITLYSIIQIFF